MRTRNTVVIASALVFGCAGLAAAATGDTSPARPAAQAAPAEPGAPAPKTLHPIPSKPVQPGPCPKRPPGTGGSKFVPPKPKVKLADLPKPVKIGKRNVDLSVIDGKGMWWTTWPTTNYDVEDMVARAKKADLRHIWVRTGGSRQGWYGEKLLTDLLPVAHKAGLKVMVWDFPFLSDPILDVRRANKAIKGTFAGHRIDGFAPDIETIYEGTFNHPKRLAVYLSRIRASAGDMPILSTVMRPSPSQIDSFPYKPQVPYIDAFVPMVYWGCNEPGLVTEKAIKFLATMRPVHPLGQSYDMGKYAGGLPSSKEIWRFLDVAKANGARGASLWTAEQTFKPQWRALGEYPW
ncbi:MAG: hypothetical protein ACT4QF_24950 [Sporichthyaceae bacterium]